MENAKMEKRACLEDKSDRLLELPRNILDQILSRLSIRDPVRTGVLSSKWKYEWTTISDLIFDDCGLQPDVFHTMINEVLLFHNGPISKFVITCKKQVPPVREFERWISYISRRRVKELVLDFSSGMCRLPSRLFSCQALTHLRLCGCAVNPSSRSRGFMNLKSLELSHVEISQDTLNKLFLSSPVLEKINLIDIPHSVARLCRCHTNIGEFRVGTLSPHGAGVLYKTYFVLGFHKNIRNDQVQINQTSASMKFHDNWSRVRSLMLGHLEVEGWCSRRENGKLYRSYLQRYTNLESLVLEIDYGIVKEILVALNFLSLPNLKELRISGQYDGQAKADTGNDFWEGNHKFGPLPRLRFVTLTGIQGTALEKGFIQFILLQSPMLERLEIAVSDNRVNLNLVADLLTFERASPKAEVVFLGDQNRRFTVNRFIANS